MRPRRQSVVEAGATAAVGALLGGLAGRPLGMSATFAAVGAANGAISGWRAVYDWRSAKGVGAFVLDSTWALGTTAAALASHAVAAARGRPGYADHLSRRQNRHVYARGFQPRRAFVITVGNVVSGAGDTANARRQRLVTDHEDVHVWQARALGPFYPILYAGWMAAGAAVGSCLWATRYRHERPFKVVESCAYYLNPFEWWAYSRDGNWPPGQMVSGLGWRRPLVRAVAAGAVTGSAGTRATPG